MILFFSDQEDKRHQSCWWSSSWRDAGSSLQRRVCIFCLLCWWCYGESRLWAVMVTLIPRSTSYHFSCNSQFAFHSFNSDASFLSWITVVVVRDSKLLYNALFCVKKEISRTKDMDDPVMMMRLNCTKRWGISLHGKEEDFVFLRKSRKKMLSERTGYEWNVTNGLQFNSSSVVDRRYVRLASHFAVSVLLLGCLSK